jgi:hypothetical protein
MLPMVLMRNRDSGNRNPQKTRRVVNEGGREEEGRRRRRMRRMRMRRRRRRRRWRGISDCT